MQEIARQPTGGHHGRDFAVLCCLAAPGTKRILHRYLMRTHTLSELTGCEAGRMVKLTLVLQVGGGYSVAVT